MKVTKVIPKLYDQEHTEFLSLERANSPPVPESRRCERLGPPSTRRQSTRQRPTAKSRHAVPNQGLHTPVNGVRVVQGTVDEPGFLKLLAQPPNRIREW